MRCTLTPPMRARRMLVCALLIGLSFTLNGLRAQAQSSFRIVVTPGVTCLHHTTLSNELIAALGDTPIPGGLAIHVRGSDDDPRTVSVRVQHADGSESLRRFSPAPERCEHLHRAVALALSLVIKASPDGARRRLEEAAPTAPGAPLPTTHKARVRRMRGAFLGLDALLLGGVLARVSGGGQLRVGLDFRHARLALLGLASRAPRERLEQQGGYQALLRGAGIQLCTAAAGRRVLVAACLSEAVGLLRVEGQGLSAKQLEQRRTWTSALSLTLERPLLPWLSLTGAADLLLVARPLQVVSRDEQEQIVDRHTLSRVGAALRVGLEVNFGVDAKR